MPFSNPIVAGEDLVRSAIRSPNFVQGVSGWIIRRDGTAEFAQVDVRGDITATHLIIYGAQGTKIELTFNATYGSIPEILFTVQAYPGHTLVDALVLADRLNFGAPALIFQSPAIDGGASAVMALLGEDPGIGNETTLQVSAALSQILGRVEQIGESTIFGETWHTVGAVGEPAFSGNWSHSGGGLRNVGFRRNILGQVELTGSAGLTAGTVTAASTIFTLPVGYRPPANVQFIVTNQPPPGTAVTPRGLIVTSAGLVRVTHFAGAIDPGDIGLEGLNFAISST